MNRTVLFISIFLLLLISKESFSQNSISLLEPIRPQYGYLMVYTYTYEESDEFGEVKRLKFKPYEIYTEENELVQNVPAYYYNPEKIKLKEGVYLIQAEMEQRKVYYYRVKIEAGKLTEIDGELLKSSDYTYTN